MLDLQPNHGHFVNEIKRVRYNLVFILVIIFSQGNHFCHLQKRN